MIKHFRNIKFGERRVEIISGCDVAEGRYETRTLSEDEMWSAFTNLFSS